MAKPETEVVQRAWAEQVSRTREMLTLAAGRSRIVQARTAHGFELMLHDGGKSVKDEFTLEEFSHGVITVLRIALPRRHAVPPGLEVLQHGDRIVFAPNNARLRPQPLPVHISFMLDRYGIITGKKADATALCSAYGMSIGTGYTILKRGRDYLFRHPDINPLLS